MALAFFGAGCFWSVEEAFRTAKGIVSTTVGYMGGTMENPSYEDVCTDKTGHVEVVQVEFDPEKISFAELLEIFWNSHNPTTLNRQGFDIGTQYRSVIFYTDEFQKQKAIESRKTLDKSKKFPKPIVTAIEKAGKFFKAEEYHQKYLMKRDLKVCH